MPAAKSSLVHPRFKREYRVTNWREYERGLRARGDVTVWFSRDAIANWLSKSTRGPGGPRIYSDLAIETSLTLRSVFGLPLRQTEGFVGSMLGLLGHDNLPVPDHTTLSRRAQSLDATMKGRPRSGRPMHLIVDSSGLQIAGQGPWSAAKHGTRGTREWRKLHIGVDESGFVVAHELTESGVDDAGIVPDLLDQVSDEVERFTADGAYDKTAVYDAVAKLGAKIVIPPVKGARVSKDATPGARARNETVEAVDDLGRREWRKQAGYHQQARVENAFFRYKQVIGGRLRSRRLNGQRSEVRIAIKILNRMLELGAPRSEPMRN